MTTNKTVNQVFTANKSLVGQLRVTIEDSQVSIQGTSAALRMLAETILATVGGGGNIFAQGYRAQLARGESSGFMLTPDSIEKVLLRCDDQAFAAQAAAGSQ